jgi:glycosyltransferase involved in cell wall biosynthesis
MQTKILPILKQPAVEDDNYPVHVSVIVPVVGQFDDLETLYEDFARQISCVTQSFEFLFIVSPLKIAALAALRLLAERDPRVRLFRFNSHLGEAAALAAGFSKARGEFLFTLAPRFQVQPESFLKVYEALKQDTDLVVTQRESRNASSLGRLQTLIFHRIASRMSGVRLHDVSCGFRGMRREVSQTITIYGDLHRFLPALANKQGFRVAEIKVPRHPLNGLATAQGVGEYFARALDILTLFFIMKFVKKPLRFFGAIGGVTALAGLAICVYLTVLRLFYNSALSDRPLLLLGALLLLGGMQTIAIGLIGEIIVFTHARESKDYEIQSIMG